MAPPVTFGDQLAAQNNRQLDPNKIINLNITSVDDLTKLGIDPKAFGKSIMGQQMPEWYTQGVLPIGAGLESVTGLALGITQAVFQGKMINAQLSYMNHVKTLQTTGMNAEISHRSELLKAQKELTVLGYGTAERLAQIQSKKEVKLAEIASDTKKSLYNSQARQQLFLRTRFYGKPVATSGTALV